MTRGSASEFLDLRVEVIGPDFLIATMPVNERTRQPLGLLHGGMSIVMAEELGSTASMMLVAHQSDTRVVGVDVGGSHLRSVRDGRVTGVCRALRIGRSMHFWTIDISDEDGRLCCSARLTVRVIRGDGTSGG
ncbi:hotdog fold thioesterase [Elongatibacter sediminis]|uniref:hotdog fold thioesterase n=1 Tax=Elongatibacter sediminis TaxID=3119006 RepID=UPI00339D5100